MCNNIGKSVFPRFVGCLAVACTLAGLNNTAYAFPSFGVANGNSCKTCHGSAGAQGTGNPLSDRANALDVLGEGLLDLDASRNDGNSRGPIPFFTAQPGDTIPLTMRVLDGSDFYAVQIKRFEKAGVLSSVANTNFLTGYTPDGAWFGHGVLPTTYYTGTTFSTPWGGGPDPWTFNLTIPLSTPIDTYDLEYAVAGRLGNAGGRLKFYGDQHFYLDVIPEPTTLVLLSTAGIGMATLRRKRQPIL